VNADHHQTLSQDRTLYVLAGGGTPVTNVQLAFGALIYLWGLGSLTTGTLIIRKTQKQARPGR
jgi:hypothetical protein